MTHRIREWLTRVAGYLTRAGRDRDLDREIRAHLEMAVEEHRRGGMSLADARALAIRELGGVMQTKEAFREQQGFAAFEGVVRDVAYACRAVRARPSFSVAVLLAIALGVGANTAVFSVAHSVLWRPLPFDEPDHLLRLFQTQTAGRADACLALELPGLGKAHVLARRDGGVARVDLRGRGSRRQGADPGRPRNGVTVRVSCACSYPSGGRSWQKRTALPVSPPR